MTTVLSLIYAIAGYWAVGEVFYGGKVLIYRSYAPIFIKRLVLGIVIGWLFIPIAIIKRFLRSR